MFVLAITASGHWNDKAGLTKKSYESIPGVWSIFLYERFKPHARRMFQDRLPAQSIDSPDVLFVCHVRITLSEVLSPMSNYTIRLATTPDEREMVYRFRYTVYVEELQYPQPFAEHANRRIQDPLDDKCGTLIALNGNDGIVGTVRINLAAECMLGQYEELFDLHSFGTTHRATVAVCTRLMVAQAYRRSRIAVDLCRAIYRYGRDHGIETCFADCYNATLPFFLHLGFRLHRASVNDPQYGLVNVIRLDLLDTVHLQSVHSPFIAETQ